MRIRPLLASLFLALAVWPAAAQDTPTTTTTPPTESTEVLGAVPASLAGRWLAVCQAQLPNGHLRPFVRLFAIADEGGTLAVHLKRSDLPKDVNAHMEAAAAAGTGQWTPTAEDLQAITKGWDDLPAALGPEYRSIETKLYAPAEYTAEMKSDDVTKDSAYAVIVNETFTGANRVMRTLTIFGIDQVEPATMKSKFITTTIAAAPLPIPITLRGEAQLIRLAGEPARKRSLAQRILDLFSGCGR